VVSLLLTGNTPEGARIKLSHYGLDHHFAGGAFCHDLEDRPSIARRAARLAAEAGGSDPSAGGLVVIGDTPHDVRAGNEIGARVLAVASGQYGREELEALEAWRVLDELPAPAEFRKLLGLGA
jgi:phosphoglycolate phosphatase